MLRTSIWSIPAVLHHRGVAGTVMGRRRRAKKALRRRTQGGEESGRSRGPQRGGLCQSDGTARCGCAFPILALGTFGVIGACCMLI